MGCPQPTPWLDLLFLLRQFSSPSTGSSIIIITNIVIILACSSLSSWVVFPSPRFDYNLAPWLGAAAFWCLLVCCSRLYLGMHRWNPIFVFGSKNLPNTAKMLLCWKVKVWTVNIFSVADIMAGLLLTPPLLFIILPLGNNPFLASSFELWISEV